MVHINGVQSTSLGSYNSLGMVSLSIKYQVKHLMTLSANGMNLISCKLHENRNKQ